MRATDPLRHEHAELLPRVDALRATADAVALLDAGALGAALDERLEFLRGHLAPHADAEDAVLYPVVDRVLGAPGVTAAMSRDRVEVHHLVAELAALRDAVAATGVDDDRRREVQRVLYGLYAVVRLHFAKEEEVYLPLLDAALSPDEADEVFDRMSSAAHAAPAH